MCLMFKRLKATIKTKSDQRSKLEKILPEGYRFLNASEEIRGCSNIIYVFNTCISEEETEKLSEKIDTTGIEKYSFQG